MGSIDIRMEADVVTMTINNPRFYNCINSGMWKALHEGALAAASDTSVRAVVLQGAGAHFTAGYDLSELQNGSLSQINQAFRDMENAISAVEAIAVPVIAAIDGFCLGGGLELALAADLRWASNHAKLGMPVAKIGIMLSPTFALRLVRVMGPSAAKDLLFTGRAASANEAYSMGLVNGIVEPTQLALEVEAIVGRIKEAYPSAVRQAKRSVGQVTAQEADAAAYFVDEGDFLSAIARFRR